MNTRNNSTNEAHADTSSTRSYHHGDLKSALVDAARRLLNSKGIEALSLRALASEVGVSHMAPYAHFKNKTELFQAIACSGFDDLTQRMQQVSNQDAAHLQILNYGTQYIEFAIANPALYKQMLTQTQAVPDMTPALQHASQQPYRLLVSAFQLLEADLSQAKIRAQGAWAMVHGLSSLLIDGHLQLPPGMDVKTYLAASSVPARLAT